MSSSTYVEQEFRKADLNKDGVIDGPEAKAYFGASGIPQGKLAEIWIAADSAKSGRLSQESFRTALYLLDMVRQNKPVSVDAIRSWTPSWTKVAAAAPSSGSGFGDDFGFDDSFGAQLNAPAAQPAQQAAHASHDLFAEQKPAAAPVVKPAAVAVQGSSAGGIFELAPATIEQHKKTFAAVEKADPKQVSGEEARGVFMKIGGLPSEDLFNIWQLVDVRKSGHLNEREFVVALALIDYRKAGHGLPSLLPTAVQSYITSSDVPASTADSKKPASRSRAGSEPKSMDAWAEQLKTAVLHDISSKPTFSAAPSGGSGEPAPAGSSAAASTTTGKVGGIQKPRKHVSFSEMISVHELAHVEPEPIAPETPPMAGQPPPPNTDLFAEDASVSSSSSENSAEQFSATQSAALTPPALPPSATRLPGAPLEKAYELASGIATSPVPPMQAGTVDAGRMGSLLKALEAASEKHSLLLKQYSEVVEVHTGLEAKSCVLDKLVQNMRVENDRMEMEIRERLEIIEKLQQKVALLSAEEARQRSAHETLVEKDRKSKHLLSATISSIASIDSTTSSSSSPPPPKAHSPPQPAVAGTQVESRSRSGSQFEDAVQSLGVNELMKGRTKAAESVYPKPDTSEPPKTSPVVAKKTVSVKAQVAVTVKPSQPAQPAAKSDAKPTATANVSSGFDFGSFDGPSSGTSHIAAAPAKEDKPAAPTSSEMNGFNFGAFENPFGKPEADTFSFDHISTSMAPESTDQKKAPEAAQTVRESAGDVAKTGGVVEEKMADAPAEAQGGFDDDWATFGAEEQPQSQPAAEPAMSDAPTAAKDDGFSTDFSAFDDAFGGAPAPKPAKPSTTNASALDSAFSAFDDATAAKPAAASPPRSSSAPEATKATAATTSAEAKDSDFDDFADFDSVPASVPGAQSNGASDSDPFADFESGFK